MSLWSQGSKSEMATHPPHLDIESLLAALARHDVDFVLTGSVVGMALGVAHSPGDLDVAPAIDDANLGRLAGMLRALGAKPRHDPAWRRGLSEEGCERWAPDPPTGQNLDHRFVTRFGELDIVPLHAGTFDHLASHAVHVLAFGLPIRVAHPDDLIALCERWARETDRRRLPALRVAGEALVRTGLPADIGARLSRR